MKRRAAYPCLAVVFLLAACQSGGPPAPVEYKGAGQQERSAQSFGGMRTVTAQRGDTIYGIARQYNVSVRALIEANNLKPPYQLRAGQVVTLSLAREHVVQKGETVYAIARRYNADPQSIIRINTLKSPYHITVGQHLRLPSPGGQQNDDAAVETVQARPVPMQMAQAQTAQASPVQVGSDSGQGAKTIIIASPNAASSARPSPEPSRPPAEMQTARPAPDSAAPPASEQTPIQDKPVQLAEENAAAPPEEARPVLQQASVQSKPPSAAVPMPPQMAGKGFLWPLRGQVIAEFGPVAKGQHNDGINIAVAAGTPVQAAQNGVVAYAGNELRGFGNLLLIKHADGWMTAYAHNETLLVQRGDKVKRGQTIAMSGSTGAVKSPQLHFELRQGTRAVDPMQHLREMQASTGVGAS